MAEEASPPRIFVEPFYAPGLRAGDRGLADVLVKVFGPPRVLAAALARIDNIDTAHIYGSRAARLLGDSADRAAADIDVLVLGSPCARHSHVRTSSAAGQSGRRHTANLSDQAGLTF